MITYIVARISDIFTKRSPAERITTTPVPDPNPKDEPDSVVHQIVTELAEHGLDWHDYRLRDTLDPDALEKLIATADSTIRVEFQVREFWVTASEEGAVNVESS